MLQKRQGLFEASHVLTAASSSVPPQFATGWQRTAAGVLDMIICLIVQSLLSIMSDSYFFIQIAYLLLTSAYYVGTECTPSQATCGKRLLNLYVATRTQHKPSVGRLAWRYFTWMLPALPMLYFVMTLDFSAVEERMSHATTQNEIHELIREPEVMMHLLKFSLSTLFAILVSVFAYFIPMFFAKERTGLHDWLSGTRVYQGKPPPAPSAPSAPDAAA